MYGFVNEDIIRIFRYWRHFPVRETFGLLYVVLKYEKNGRVAVEKTRRLEPKFTKQKHNVVVSVLALNYNDLLIFFFCKKKNAIYLSAVWNVSGQFCFEFDKRCQNIMMKRRGSYGFRCRVLGFLGGLRSIEESTIRCFEKYA